MTIGTDPTIDRSATAPGRWSGRSLGARVAFALGSAAATVLVSTFVIYVALSFAPGDPVTQILGGRATEEARAALRAELGLDQPVIVRYLTWLSGAVQGDFGTSYTYRQDVTALVTARVETTLLLVVMAAVLTLLIGLALGALGGVSARFRPAVNVTTSLGISIPAFVAAGYLTTVFAVQLRLFPTFGGGNDLLDELWHLTLPAIALSIGYSAYLARVTSSVVAEEADREFVVTSTGRGIPFPLTLRRHILPNAALPVLTVAGLVVAGLIAGAVVVERAFAIDGLGSLLIASVFSKDYPVVSAISLIIVLAFVVVTTVIDFAQTALDPRQRALS